MRELSINRKQAGIESMFILKPGEIEKVCLTCNSEKCNGNCKKIREAEKEFRERKKLKKT